METIKYTDMEEFERLCEEFFLNKNKQVILQVKNFNKRKFLTFLVWGLTNGKEYRGTIDSLLLKVFEVSK